MRGIQAMSSRLHGFSIVFGNILRQHEVSRQCSPTSVVHTSNKLNNVWVLESSQHLAKVHLSPKLDFAVFSGIACKIRDPSIGPSLLIIVVQPWIANSDIYKYFGHPRLHFLGLDHVTIVHTNITVTPSFKPPDFEFYLFDSLLEHTSWLHK